MNTDIVSYHDGGNGHSGNIPTLHIDGLVQERRHSSALALEWRLSCTNPSIYRSRSCALTAGRQGGGLICGLYRHVIHLMEYSMSPGSHCLGYYAGALSRCQVSANHLKIGHPHIDQSDRYGCHQAACREPVGSYDKTTRTALCFEHKTQLSFNPCSIYPHCGILAQQWHIIPHDFAESN